MFKEYGEDWSLIRDAAASHQIDQWEAAALSDEEEIPHFRMQMDSFSSMELW
jgi:hypothetical protein